MTVCWQSGLMLRVARGGLSTDPPQLVHAGSRMLQKAHVCKGASMHVQPPFKRTGTPYVPSGFCRLQDWDNWGYMSLS